VTEKQRGGSLDARGHEDDHVCVRHGGSFVFFASLLQKNSIAPASARPPLYNRVRAVTGCGHVAPEVGAIYLPPSQSDLADRTAGE
jgi:hypothetical protein